MKSYSICHTCKNKITGVEKFDGKSVYCSKCFKILEKEEQKRRDHEKLNWYREGMTDDEYYNKVFDTFC